MTGRKPKPTRVRELEGNRGKRKLNRSEPEFAPAAPSDCPDWLSDRAKAEWARLAPDLIALGLLTKADLVPFAAYCQCYSHWVEAELFVQEHGTTASLRSDKGEVKAVVQVPQIGIALRMLDKIRSFASEFGLTPSSRGRIELEAQGARGGAYEDLSEEALREEYERIKNELAKAVGGDRKAAVQ